MHIDLFGFCEILKRIDGAGLNLPFSVPEHYNCSVNDSKTKYMIFKQKNDNQDPKMVVFCILYFIVPMYVMLF